jgi:hypothetical protein
MPVIHQMDQAARQRRTTASRTVANILAGNLFRNEFAARLILAG